jgi:predicted TIM-barrel fold metal-dependent hydrolase
MASALPEALWVIDRRSFLMRAVAAVGPATGAPSDRVALAQTPDRTLPRIDIHHHFAPPAWVAEVRAVMLQTANTTRTPEKSIEDLDRAGSAAAVISVTNPGLWFGDGNATAHLARACNESGAKLVQQYPTRFGLFAAMPLPDVDATLKEIVRLLPRLSGAT